MAAVVVVAAALVIVVAVPALDDRTESERLILTKADLTSLNATDKTGPSPSPGHPDFRNSNGSEAAESRIWFDYDDWPYSYIDCLLILYNSSAQASHDFHARWSDTNWTGEGMGEGCFVGEQERHEFNGTQPSYTTLTVVVLEGDTITYLQFTVHWDGQGGPITVPRSVIEDVVEAQVSKIRSGA